MKLGVTFPHTHIGPDPQGVRAYAEAAQGLGFDHLVAYDHVLGADPAHYPGWTGPYTNASQFHELFVLFGYLAGLTPELELVASVVVLPQRQTALVAKQAAEVDLLTRGRFRLGVGIGWNAVEYEALGENFRNRARRFEEQIALMRRLWQEPSMSFEGEFHTVRGAGISPLPVQRPIPVWIGGSAEPALRRAATLADGFFPQQPLAEGWTATLQKMRGWRESAGKSWDGFGIEARVSVGSGTPEDWRMEAEQWAQRGATHLSLSVSSRDAALYGPDSNIARIRQAWEALH